VSVLASLYTHAHATYSAFRFSSSRGVVGLTMADFARLEPDEWFNDELMQFALAYVFRNSKLSVTDFEASASAEYLKSKQPDAWAESYIFNTFFYTKLGDTDRYAICLCNEINIVTAPFSFSRPSEEERGKAWTAILKWTKKEPDFLKKKFIVVPCHEGLVYSSSFSRRQC
jgi:Ulp1 family protease